MIRIGNLLRTGVGAKAEKQGRRRLPSPAMMVALIALFVALGGSATAALVITGANIKNGTVTGLDLKNGTVSGYDLKTAAVTGGKVKNGTLMAADFKAGQLPTGGRAYGRVAGDGTLTRSKNVTGITHPFTGVYCIALAAGIDVSQTGVVATVDQAAGTDGPEQLYSVAWYSPGISCPVGQLQVLTHGSDFCPRGRRVQRRAVLLRRSLTAVGLGRRRACFGPPGASSHRGGLRWEPSGSCPPFLSRVSECDVLSLSRVGPERGSA
jgi:hypothetical protein